MDLLPHFCNFQPAIRRAVGIVIVLLMCVGSTRAFAQEEEKSSPFLSVTGSFMVTSDLYSSSASPDSAQPARRPSGLYRLIFTPTLAIGDFISLPFNIILTSPETNTNTPSTPHPTLSQFFENPANSLGFSSFSPKIGWAQFNAGSFTPVLTPLTAGDQQIFGGGFDLKPGSLQFAASVGVAQRAIESDTAHRTIGRYRKDMYTARAAIGKADSSHFGLNVVYAKDAASSLANNIISIAPAHPSPDDPSVTIPTDTVRLRAEEGTVASADFGVAIADGISFQGEAATSIFTRDQSSTEQAIAGNPLGGLLTTRTSTRADFAGNSSLSLRQKLWGISLSGIYMGAGFVPIGYAFFQADRFEWKASPELHLFNRKLDLRGSIGERVNNLSKTKGETSTLLIGSTSMNAEISDAFSLSVSYSNFGLRNDQTSDTLKVQNVSQSLSIDPTLTIMSETMSHMISLSMGLDSYDDFNTITGAQSSNKTRSLVFTYNVSFTKNPLSLGTTETYLENELPTGALIIRSAGVTGGYALFDRKLFPSLSVTTSGSTDGTGVTDDQLFLKAALRWEVIKNVSLQGSWGNNHYNYGNPAIHGSAFKEQLVQLALTTRF
jgi:hypothetical protein